MSSERRDREFTQETGGKSWNANAYGSGLYPGHEKRRSRTKRSNVDSFDALTLIYISTRSPSLLSALDCYIVTHVHMLSGKKKKFLIVYFAVSNNSNASDQKFRFSNL